MEYCASDQDADHGHFPFGADDERGWAPPGADPKQLGRLAHLEEALLVLSRLDAGTLLLQKSETDVFTLLMLAADNLQELFAQAGVSADIPELGDAGFCRSGLDDGGGDESHEKLHGTRRSARNDPLFLRTESALYADPDLG